jgi:hypothetical protein
MSCFSSFHSIITAVSPPYFSVPHLTPIVTDKPCV